MRGRVEAKSHGESTGAEVQRLGCTRTGKEEAACDCGPGLDCVGIAQCSEEYKEEVYYRRKRKRGLNAEEAGTTCGRGVINNGRAGLVLVSIEMQWRVSPA